jgi:3-hydroxyisobutyrate dehydrogenase
MNIGFIGLGIMGQPMATNLVKKRAADSVHVFDLDSARIAAMKALGAKAAASIKDVGSTCDVVFTMVPTSDNVKQVYSELLAVARPGQVLCDMSTIDPDVARGLAAEVAATGAKLLDAPVVKSQPAAVAGTLGIYVGGEAQALDVVREFLLCMGNNVIHMGGNGTGLVMKACHNQLVAQIQNGVNEMVTLAAAYGISVDDFVKAISFGGGQNFYLDAKAAAIRDHTFATAFSVRNMHKDVGIVSRLAEAKDLSLPGIALVADVYQQAMAQGLADLDFSATFKVVNKKN